MSAISSAGRRARLCAALAFVAGVALSAVTVWQASYSAFSATTANPANNWAAGNVALTDDDSNSALFTITNMKPGDSGAKCIVVTSNSSVDTAVKLYVSPGTFAQNRAVADNLWLSITQGTSTSSGGDCSGFNADAGAANNFTGLLSTFAAAYTSFSTGWDTWAPAAGNGVQKTYLISYTFNNAGNQAATDAMQGGSAQAGFTWEAQNNWVAASYATCAAAVGASPGTAAALAYPLSEGSGTIATDISGNGNTAKYAATGVTYNAAGPCPSDGAKAVTLNGASGYVYTNKRFPGPQLFSYSVWFKTTVAGGTLAAFTDTQSGGASQYDRLLYLDAGGNLNFGVYSGGTQVIQSPAGYADGTWHHAVATLAPATNDNPGTRLYVDGALVASNSAYTSAQTGFTGYFRFGSSTVTGWPRAVTTQPFFNGSVAFAAIYDTALTPAEVAAIHNAAT